MLRTLRYQYLSILWAIFVVVVCVLPPIGDGHSGFTFFEGFDKLAHTGFFFVLTVFLFNGKIREQKSYSYRIQTIFKIVLINLVLGGGIEIFQLEVFTYRSAEWWDFFADMLGLAMGIFSYIFLHRVRYYEKVL